MDRFTFWLANIFRAVLLVMAFLMGLIALSELFQIFTSGWIHLSYFAFASLVVAAFVVVATHCDKVMVRIIKSRENE
jgi:hypothetical protein